MHKDCRGQRAGQKLLARILEEAKKQEGRFHVIMGMSDDVLICEALSDLRYPAGVTTDDPRRTKFWAGQGFELRGTLKEVGKKFGKWLDVSYYQLML